MMAVKIQLRKQWFVHITENILTSIIKVDAVYEILLGMQYQNF